MRYFRKIFSRHSGFAIKSISFTGLLITVVHVCFSNEVRPLPSQDRQFDELASSKVCLLQSPDKEANPAVHQYPGRSLNITTLYPTMAQVISVIGASSDLNSWAANIGARDGVSHRDEVFQLYDQLGYTGIAVEADVAFSVPLKSNLPAHVKIITEFATPGSIGKILQESEAPVDLDVVKMDIDSYDCDVMEAVLRAGFRPKHIFMEVNPWIPPPFSWAMKYISLTSKFNPFNIGQADALIGCSLQYAHRTVSQFGYVLIGMRGYHDENASGVDAMFVREEYAGLFGDIPHLPVEVYRNWFQVACKRYHYAHQNDSRGFFMPDATRLLNMNSTTSGHIGIEEMFGRAFNYLEENNLAQRPMTFERDL